MEFYARPILNSEEKKAIFSVRKKVFVEEQAVPENEEYDDYEDSACHFCLLDSSGKVIGTARYRTTTDGLKLERFAILKEYRSQGAGTILLKAVLSDIKAKPEFWQKKIYLHAQLTARNFYFRAGFIGVGDNFFECEIEHQKMVLNKWAEDLRS